MNNVERILKPFQSNEDAWDYLYEFERLGKQIKVERKNRIAHKKLVADIYSDLKRINIQEKLKKMNPDFMLFPELNVNKISNKTRKKQFKNNLKKRLRNAQLELEIQGTQKGLVEFENPKVWRQESKTLMI